MSPAVYDDTVITPERVAAMSKPSRHIHSNFALPFRSPGGRVNLHLCRSSLEKAFELHDQGALPVASVMKLAVWTRHAVRWVSEHSHK